MAFRKNYRKTKKRGGAAVVKANPAANEGAANEGAANEGDEAEAEERRRLFWKTVLKNALPKVESKEMSYIDLESKIVIAKDFNVDKELILRAEAAAEKAKADEKKAKADEKKFLGHLQVLERAGALKAVDDEPVDPEQRKKMMKEKGSFHKDSYATKNIKSVSKELLETYNLQRKTKSKKEYSRVHKLLYPKMTNQDRSSKPTNTLEKEVDYELEYKIEELNVQLLKPLAIFVYQNYTNNFEIDIEKIKNIILVIYKNPSLKYTIYGHVTKLLLPFSNAEKKQSMKKLNQLYKTHVPNHSSSVYSSVYSSVFKRSMKDQLDEEEKKAKAIDTSEVLGKKSSNKIKDRQGAMQNGDNEMAAAAAAGGGKRRNTRRHKKKANQTHHKKRRRNSRKKHNTRRKR
jgi:hypothetical protein